ncbi:MAG: hypothetical protein JWQ64_1268, partial [Subtercola sp.]|nr:hypothetical protein [Subtercola sp.]
MATEIGVWRVNDQPVRISPASIPLESKLENLIMADPAILGVKLLLLGNQILTAFGKFIDILAIDAEGNVHILELKRDKTPRDVVAQTLDYASWVSQLGGDEIRLIFETHNPSQSFDAAFAERFDGAPVPDELNADMSLTIVASDLDSSTERIVSYLNIAHGVPINVMLFRYFADGGNHYLVRSWLVDDSAATASKPGGKPSARRAVWNE